MPCGMVGRVGPRNHVLSWTQIFQHGVNVGDMGQSSVTYGKHVASAVQKWPNRSSSLLQDREWDGPMNRVLDGREHWQTCG